jgi:nickel-dependent lactate racemase
MRVVLHYGREQLDCDVRDADVIAVSPRTPIVAVLDIAQSVRAALESPLDYPPLRQALTPDDRVTVVVDEKLPHLVDLLVPLLEHIGASGIPASAVTLLCPRSDSRQDWLEELPDSFQDVHCQMHAPGDRKQLRYLATTKRGRRLYLSSAAVDADQVVVLSGRGYDPRLGYSGAEGSLFPALSDEETLAQTNDSLSLAAPGEVTWPLRAEASEAAWLLGAPFFVQVIPGEGEDIAAVVAGPAASSMKGEQELDVRWRRTVPNAVATVVATVSGDPLRLGFSEVAAAAACAARVVYEGGRIILLTRGAINLGSAGELIRGVASPQQALALLHKQKPPDMAAGYFWASAAMRARIYLLSDVAGEVAEELFAVPLEHPRQVSRLLEEPGSVLILNDAHKMMVTTE